jgi:hypothetical protein
VVSQYGDRSIIWCILGSENNFFAGRLRLNEIDHALVSMAILQAQFIHHLSVEWDSQLRVV